MVTFRNNNRRAQFRTNNNRRPSFRRNNDDGSKFSNNDNFQRKVPGRNNHNAPKLIEKYNDLAREASSNGDKILSENYLQHADHFMRILNEQENQKKIKFSDNKTNETNLDIGENTSKSQEINSDEKNVLAEIKTTIKEKTETS